MTLSRPSILYYHWTLPAAKIFCKIPSPPRYWRLEGPTAFPGSTGYERQNYESFTCSSGPRRTRRTRRHPHRRLHHRPRFRPGFLRPLPKRLEERLTANRGEPPRPFRNGRRRRPVGRHESNRENQNENRPLQPPRRPMGRNQLRSPRAGVATRPADTIPPRCAAPGRSAPALSTPLQTRLARLSSEGEIKPELMGFPDSLLQKFLAWVCSFCALCVLGG